MMFWILGYVAHILLVYVGLCLKETEKHSEDTGTRL